VEPLIAPVDLSTAATAVDLRQFVQWIICGGETGPRARTCDLQWIRTVRDTAVAAAIPFFVKSHGGHDGNGRELDGITWSEFPEDLCRRAGGRGY
jgi:protein gp37